MAAVGIAEVALKTQSHQENIQKSSHQSKAAHKPRKAQLFNNGRGFRGLVLS